MDLAYIPHTATDSTYAKPRWFMAQFLIRKTYVLLDQLKTEKDEGKSKERVTVATCFCLTTEISTEIK
jgi:hypothetical protein